MEKVVVENMDKLSLALSSVVHESVHTFLSTLSEKYGIDNQELLLLWKEHNCQNKTTTTAPQSPTTQVTDSTTTTTTSTTTTNTDVGSNHTCTNDSKASTSSNNTCTNDSKASSGTITKAEADDKAKTIQIPNEFSCPILSSLMVDPVVTSDGHTYERNAILHWLKDHNTSPKTMKQLDNKNVVPNHILRAQIIDFRKANNIKEEEIWKPPEPTNESKQRNQQRQQQRHINIQINQNNPSNRLPPIWNPQQTQQARTLIVFILQNNPSICIDSGILESRQRGMSWLQCADHVIRAPHLMRSLDPFMRKFEVGQMLMALVDQRQRDQAAEVERQMIANELPPMRALRNDDAGTLMSMIDNGACQPHLVSEGNKQNMLHVAAKMGKTRCLFMLLSRNFFVGNIRENASPEELMRSIDGQDQNGSTPLHLACFYGHTAIVRKLVDSDANVNSRMRHGDTPLIQACWNGHVEVIKILLSCNSIQINATKEDGCTALQLAIVRHKHEVIRMLLSHVNVEMRKTMSTCVNMAGDNALHIAAGVGCSHAIESLLLMNDNSNNDSRDNESNENNIQNFAIPMLLHRNQLGLAPIHLAAHRGNEEVVKLLIECIFTAKHPDAVDSNGQPVDVDVVALGPDYPSGKKDLPLHIAAERGFLKTCKLLLDAGSNCNSRHPVSLMTPLHYAARKGFQAHKEIIELLGRYDVKDIVDANGLTALCVACSTNNIGIVRALINIGMKVNPTGTRDGVTPLIKACCVASIHAGHNRNSSDNVQDIMSPTVKLLLDAGANVDHQLTTSKNSALHLAASRGSMNICRLLLDAGGNSKLIDRGGLTAADVAKRNHFNNVAVFIENYDGGG